MPEYSENEGSAFFESELKPELKQLGDGVEQREEERLKTLVFLAPDVNLNPTTPKAKEWRDAFFMLC